MRPVHKKNEKQTEIERGEDIERHREQNWRDKGKEKKERKDVKNRRIKL